MTALRSRAHIPHLNVQDCVALYAEKYDEEFEPFFATFVQDTWALLSSASATR